MIPPTYRHTIYSRAYYSGIGVATATEGGGVLLIRLNKQFTLLVLAIVLLPSVSWGQNTTLAGIDVKKNQCTGTQLAELKEEGFTTRNTFLCTDSNRFFQGVKDFEIAHNPRFRRIAQIRAEIERIDRELEAIKSSNDPQGLTQNQLAQECRDLQEEDQQELVTGSLVIGSQVQFNTNGSQNQTGETAASVQGGNQVVIGAQ